MTASQMAAHSCHQPVIGVLLVHGFNGSRADFAEMEAVLQAQGMLTHTMLLPGHGTHVRDLMAMGWADWAQAVHQEVTALKQRCDVVFLVGHSMGGALALHTAAHEEVAGVVSMCAPLSLYPGIALGVHLAKWVTPVLPTIREDVRNPQARRDYTRTVYRWTALSPVASLLRFLPQLRAELPRVRVPALIMAATHDHVVPASNGRKIYDLIGSRQKELMTLHRSYHVIMKDYDREEVFAKTVAFMLTTHPRSEADSSCQRR
jgi:carboxylesterase